MRSSNRREGNLIPSTITDQRKGLVDDSLILGDEMITGRDCYGMTWKTWGSQQYTVVRA